MEIRKEFIQFRQLIRVKMADEADYHQVSITIIILFLFHSSHDDIFLSLFDFFYIHRQKVP